MVRRIRLAHNLTLDDLVEKLAFVEANSATAGRSASIGVSSWGMFSSGELSRLVVAVPSLAYMCDLRTSKS